MIIGFDGSRAFTANKTGTENYSYQLLVHLAKIDKVNQYKVFLRPSNLLPKHLVWPKNFQFIQISYPYLWTQVGLASKTFFEKLDLLFVPAHTIPLIYKPGLKTVITVHDLGSEYLPGYHQFKQRLYLSLMQNYQLKNASFLIAVSNATKQDLIKKIGISAKKIQVVYEGYDQKLFNQENFKIKAKTKTDTLTSILKYYEIEKYRYFLFVGTIQPRKNLSRVIYAFKQYLDALDPLGKNAESRSMLASNLVLIGKKGWLAEEIYELPKQLGILDRVKFLDYVKSADLPALYAGASALVYPSLFEGFGLPILESQACGCPVITSDVSSMPEVAGKGAILVDPTNIFQINKVMMQVQDHRIRADLVKAGVENIQRFSWEKCALETLEVLEKA